MGIMLWALQRITAVITMAFVTICYSYFSEHVWQYGSLKSFLTCPLYGSITLFALSSLALHAVIGIWTISTDYLKCRTVRYLFLIAYNSALLLGLIQFFLAIARLA